MHGQCTSDSASALIEKSSVGRGWQQAVTDAVKRDTERRLRVLRYPDLAARLCAPPLSYSRPERWSGWIMPRTLPDDRPYGSTAPETPRLNTSPARTALVDIAAEAFRREAAGRAQGHDTAEMGA